MKTSEKVVVITIAADVQLVVLIGLSKLYSAVMDSYAEGSPSRLPFLTKLVIEAGLMQKLIMCFPVIFATLAFLGLKSTDRQHFTRNCMIITGVYLLALLVVTITATMPALWMLLRLSFHIIVPLNSHS